MALAAALVVVAFPAGAEALADVLGPWHCVQAEAGQGGDHCIGAAMEFTAERRYAMTAPEGCAWAGMPPVGMFTATGLDDSVALDLSGDVAVVGEAPAARVAVRVVAEGLAEFSFSSFGMVELAIPMRVVCAAGGAP